MDISYLFTERTYKNDERGASSQALSIVSRGSRISGRILIAGGKSQEFHPTLIISNSYPGGIDVNDIAVAFMRAGVNVVTFGFRGAYGSEGEFRFMHAVQDLQAVVKHICQLSVAREYHIDTDNIFLFGHGVGGFASLSAAAEGAFVRGVIALAPYDVGGMYIEREADVRDLIEKGLQSQYHVSPPMDVLLDDARIMSQRRCFTMLGPLLAGKPILFIGGMEDTLAPSIRHIGPLFGALMRKGATLRMIDGNHNFEGNINGVIQTTAVWLADNLRE